MGRIIRIAAPFLLGLLPVCALPQSFVPKELDGWQSWVLYDTPFLRCPFFANTDGAGKEKRVCTMPGRLGLELTQGGGRFTQDWTTYSEGWLLLPGNAENWPVEVTMNGAPAAVVSRDGVPQIFVGSGTYSIGGQFRWTHRPESLAVPEYVGLVSLTVDGQKMDQVDRADSAIWLGRHRDTEVAKEMDVQVYRLLSDDIPLQLDTRIVLRVTGDPREETLSPVLPKGFEPMSLHSPLPARLGTDGTLRLQVRAGNWTLEMGARAPEKLADISVPAASGAWPKQEIWSYRGNDRLRVAVVEGAEAVDASQVNVPQDWREYPGYRVAAGGDLHIVEHSRGSALQETNHLTLRRDLYLDFSHRGFTVVDAIDGQMRADWRLDMRPPFTLAHAALGGEDLLVTRGVGDLTGVEIRRPEIKLSSLARVDQFTGSMPATGWNQRFDQVRGTLTLPPGHRLLAALGVDRAPGVWLEQWTLMDIFLMLLASAVAFRLFGPLYAAAALLGIGLIHQENQFIVWWLLFALVTLTVFRRTPEGRFRTLSRWLHYAALALLLLQIVPFGVEQIRFALYPQLADLGSSGDIYELKAARTRAVSAASQSAPRAESLPAAAAPAPALEEMVVENPYGLGALVSSGPFDYLDKQRYAPGALVQAGPGIPTWHYVRYDYGWSGPVDAAQNVRFVVLSPFLVAIWRIAGVALLIWMFWSMTRSDSGITKIGRRLLSARATLVPLMVAALMSGALVNTGRAASTPDDHLLDELKTRLLQPSPCVPNCADTMSARVSIEAATYEIDLSVASLANLAIALPTMGQRTDPGSISVDGNAIAGAYRDGNQKLWVPLKPGVHSVKISGHLSPADAIALVFPQPPRAITVSAQGWDVAGIAGEKLLGNTLQLTRRQTSPRDGSASLGSDRFSPYVRVRREFALALDWSVTTHVQRIAPEHGGFTLEIPLLPGESVLTAGLDTNKSTRVAASFDTDAGEFRWDSALPQSDHFELQAPKDQPWSEVWAFRVSPMWRVAFEGTPAVLPEAMQPDNWTYEYYPRAGERLKVNVSRPSAVVGNTLAIDFVTEVIDVGNRSRDATLTFSYRSTQGKQHLVTLPAGARLTVVKIDGKTVPLRAENGQVPLALVPGAHTVQIDWQSDDAMGMLVRAPTVDLKAVSSNVTTTLELGQRWILFAAGRGVGPAILYWGELAVFVVLALMLGRSPLTPLRSHEWLLLGLGLSTFSWFVLLLAVVWMSAIRWREGLNVQMFGRRNFKLLQAALIGLTAAAVVGVVLAIPYGLLASPDMRINGIGQSSQSVSWFTDQSANQLPGAWVFSVSLWWYKAAMLAWALWLAFALTRWLPLAWRALNAGSFWEPNNAAAVSGPEPGAVS